MLLKITTCSNLNNNNNNKEKIIKITIVISWYFQRTLLKRVILTMERMSI